MGGGLSGYEWEIDYRTSAITLDRRPVDILHDFYIPALRRSVGYDRMAGYFSSSFLAAASQGFSSFVGRTGHLRLVVGASLAAQDVEAILKGDEERLTSRLDESLGDPGAWPEDVERGVDLLTWMVAHRYLELRVAIRIHRERGNQFP